MRNWHRKSWGEFRMENKVLGKGLSALIGQKPAPKEEKALPELRSGNNPQHENIHSDGVVSSLEIKSIKENSLQPRQNYDEAKLEELKSSIKEKGILQPILVRQSGAGYEVVAGERRFRAARALGLQKVPVIVKNVTDREALVLALVENIQREELNAIEEAQGFKRLIEEFNFSQDSVADSVGRDRSTITNLLRLLKLPKEIQDHVAAGKISAGHARPLLSISDAALQKKLAGEIIAKHLSVRQVEAIVKRAAEADGSAKPKAGKPKDRDLQILEEEMGRLLGTKVAIEDKGNKGKIVVEYYSLDDFDRILGALRK